MKDSAVPRMPRTDEGRDMFAKLTPLMVDKGTAAGLFGMCTATYTKAEKRGLVPSMNALGRVSIYALQQAALRLDGLLGRLPQDDPDDLLARWEAEYAG